MNLNYSHRQGESSGATPKTLRAGGCRLCCKVPETVVNDGKLGRRKRIQEKVCLKLDYCVSFLKSATNLAPTTDVAAPFFVTYFAQPLLYSLDHSRSLHGLHNGDPILEMHFANKTKKNYCAGQASRASTTCKMFFILASKILHNEELRKRKHPPPRESQPHQNGQSRMQGVMASNPGSPSASLQDRSYIHWPRSKIRPIALPNEGCIPWHSNELQRGANSLRRDESYFWFLGKVAQAIAHYKGYSH